MSMHKVPVTELERRGLESHGLDIGTPSQLSDVFRQGVAWGSSSVQGESVAWVIDTEDGHGVDYYPGKGLDTLEPGTKLYTQADPAEVERLHGKIETMRNKNNEYCEEVMALRAQMAERDAKACAMLELAVEALKDLDHKSDWVKGVQADIERYLSASAEPQNKEL